MRTLHSIARLAAAGCLVQSATYTIACGAKPVMKSITVELAE